MNRISIRLVGCLVALGLLSTGAARAQTGTALWPGEVAVLGYSAAPGGAVDFSFAPLVDLAPGTQLRLTNAGWLVAGGFRAGETTIIYTAPAGVTKGKVITYSVNRANFSGPLPLAAAGDQLLLYQGSDLAPTFVAALTYGPGGFADATSAATTALPPGLTLGSSALALPTQPTGYYSGPTRAGLPADLRAALTNPATWSSSPTRYVAWPKTALAVSEGLVPDAVELAALQKLYVNLNGATWYNRTNWLQGTNNAEHWATWFGLQTAGGDVTSLYLQNNNINGPLPAAIGDLAGLLNISFGRNHFASAPGAPALSGPLPKELGKLVRLRYLDISFTEVEGSLPIELGNMRALQYMALNNNRLSGPIPRQLGQLTNLTLLNLDNYYRPVFDGHRNAFTGGIPKELGQLTNLTSLALDMNPLGGSLPAELGNLTKLTFLEVDDAHLSGPVPGAILALPALQTLILGNQNRGYADPNTFTSLPDPSLIANPAGLSIQFEYNQFEFGTLEPYFTGPGRSRLQAATYLPQTLPTDTVRLALAAGQALSLPSRIGGAHSRYQWQRLVARAWQDLPGDSAATHAIASASYSDAGTYRCRVINSWVTGLTLYSQPTALKWTCPALRLSLSPSTAVELGNSATLKATATPAAPAGGQPAPTYAWSPATGLSSTTAVLVGATPRQTTTYTCTVRDACGQTATAQVTVRVNPVPALVNPPVEGVAPPALVNAPPPSRATALDSVNFVRTYIPRVALTDTAAVRLGSKAQVQVSTQYLDGLGRPIQTVLRQESPRGNDIVQPVAYDALGRSPRQYQPYASATPASDPGQYRPDALRQQYDFYRQDPATTPLGPGNLNDNIAPTGVAYAETVFEASPLNRVLQQAAPGESWSLASGHQQQRLERPNTALDSIPRYAAAYGATTALANGLTYQGLYPAGELWTTEAQDEHGFRTREYKDKLGQVIAKRVECPRPGSNGGPGGPGQAGATWLSTYYVYDDFSRLRCVIPPKASAGLPKATPAYTVAAAVEPLLFRYRYDGRGRVLAKVVPGQAGETQLVYDALDRPVLSQDASQRAKNQWSFTKYEALGRVVLTGLVSRNVPQATAQAEADAQAAAAALPLWEQRLSGAAGQAGQGYSLGQAYPRLGTGPASAGYFAPLAAAQLLSVAYYDDYDFDNDGQANVAYDPQLDAQLVSSGNPAPIADLRTQGLATGSRTRVLGVLATAPGAWLSTSTFYDEKARPVQVQSTNARGGAELVTSVLDFAGKVRQSVSRHEGPNHAPLLVSETMRYDHAERLTQTSQQLLGVEARPVLIDSLRYNEIGQLVQRQLGSGALLQQVKYAYNPRGWLVSLNTPDQPVATDLFSLSLHYEQGFAVPQYNGNITGQRWRGRDGVERAYGYLYDGANRLLQGDYVARTATSGPWAEELQRYALRRVRYDENGNILGMQRRGLVQQPTRRLPAQYGWVDKLAYTYTANSNQLRGVQDTVTTNQLTRATGYNGAPTSLAGDFQELASARAATNQDYAYDANGNLTLDKNKNITRILYNYLNLPRQIQFGVGADSVVFRYTAAGQKVAKLVYQTGKPSVRTDYLGPYQYEADSLRFFPHAEGRVLRLVATDLGGTSTVRYAREFTVKDHLGNLRLAYRVGQRRTMTATLEQDPTTRQRETQQFDSLSVSPPVAQPGPARTGQYVARLNAGGSTPQPLGPLAQVGVQKGDTVVVTAYGLYPQPTQHGFLFGLATWLAGILHPVNQAPVSDRAHPALPWLQVGLAAGLTQLPQLGGGVPKGYLRVLVFGKDSSLVSQQVQALSAAALGAYEQLRLQAIVPQDGYVTAYVGNESDVDVLFDDVQVEHRPGLQVQENQYDPWGLSLAGLDYSTPGIKGLNQYQFNGKEQERELGLSWQDFNWRHYEPAIGRFFGADRLAEKFVYMTDYQFASNNPTSKVEIDGLEGWMPTPEAMIWGSTPFYRTGPSGDPHRDDHNIEVSKEIAKKNLVEIAKQGLFIIGGEILGAGLELLGNGGRLAAAGAEAAPATSAASRAGAESLAQGGELSNGARMIEQVLPGKLTIQEGVKFSESEVNAANHMRKLGNDVYLRGPTGTRAGGGTSDLLVNGKTPYDVYTPITTNSNRIISAIASKNSQTSGVVLDLSKTSVTPNQLGNILQRVQGAGARNIADVVIMGAK